MSYLVLARKFRPQTFASVVGQEHITTALANAIVRQTVPHALLLTGPRGVGKTTSARIFAKALNCNGRALPEVESELSDEARRDAVEPCGECSNCKDIAASTSLSVWEVDGASHNSVDNVRDLIDSLKSLPPPGSRHKVYIIDEVHMLSTAAFNALLKSLEEPPPNTVFVFATTEPHKIPDTVISRCQRHDFRRIPTETIVRQLREIVASEKIKIADDVLYFVARRAQGGMRDAQSMLDRLLPFGGDTINLELAQKVFGVVGSSFFFALSDAVIKQDNAACFELLDKAFAQSIDVRGFIADFVRHWRNLLVVSLTRDGQVVRSGVKSLLEVSEEELRDLVLQSSVGTESFDIQRLFDIAEQTAESAIRSSFPRYVLEAGVAKMAALPTLRPLAEILGQLQNGKYSEPIKKQDNLSQTSVAAWATAETGSIAVPTGASAFDPSWQDFVRHAADRNKPTLAAFLRRVRPASFLLGKLLIEGAEFDVKSLADSSNLSSLKDCLHSYSGHSEWQVEFSETRVAIQVDKGHSGYTSGSLADRDEKAKKENLRRIQKEASGQPSVKAVLEAFAGSSIERVDPLKK